MSAAALDVDLVCAQLDFFTCGMALGSLWFASRRGFFYRFGHDSLLLADVSDSNSAFGVSLVSWTGGAEWARELGDYSCDLHREFTSFPHLCTAVPKRQAMPCGNCYIEEGGRYSQQSCKLCVCHIADIQIRF